MLDNITITSTDLRSKKNNILSRYDSDHEIFSNSISEAKRETYAELKARLRGDYPGDTDAQIVTKMGKVRDVDDVEYLKTRLVYLSIANIYEQNELLSEAAYYRQLAHSTPLEYYVDDDSDSTLDTGEEMIHKTVMFGR